MLSLDILGSQRFKYVPNLKPYAASIRRLRLRLVVRLSQILKNDVESEVDDQVYWRNVSMKVLKKALEKLSDAGASVLDKHLE